MKRIGRTIGGAICAVAAGAMLLGTAPAATAAPAVTAAPAYPATVVPGHLPDGIVWEASEPDRTAGFSPYWEFNWGIVTGTLYLNRNETRNARDIGYIIGLGAAVCSGAGGICMPIAAQAGGIAIAAGRYYEEGNCVKLKVIGPTLKPERQKRGAKGCY